MRLDWAGLLGVFGPISISIMFVVLGLLSRRLGHVTRTRPYYIGFFVAALLAGISALIRLVNLGLGPEAAAALGRYDELVLLYTGLMALAVTIAALVAWRYWSWLLAERD
jgi:hypothetical protein